MAGIGLVPLITLLTRKPLGGVVFAIAIPGLILAIAERFFSLRHGTQALSITWYGTLIVSVCRRDRVVVPLRAVGDRR